MKGYVQIYTGNGKGKTTAALGLAIRALGAGLRVCLIQFVKGMVYSEIKMLESISPRPDIHQYGQTCFIETSPQDKDIALARAGFAKAAECITGGNYDLVILDEIFIALFYKMISEAELSSLIRQKPANLELVLTGRYAPDSIIEQADLVTEMKEIRHYYATGVPARKGIEM